MITRSVLFMAFILVILCGCTAAGYKAVNPAEYSHNQKIFDLTFGWNLKPLDQRLLVDGYARSTRYYLMRGLTVTVALLASDGTERTRETVIIHPSELRIDELTSFSMILNRQPLQGDKLRFSYRYVAFEGSDEGLFWMNSFDVPAILD